MTGFRLGERIAPPRFVAFVALLALGFAVLTPPLGLLSLGWGRGTMAAFDLAAGVFLLSIAGLLRCADPDRMRALATRNDANRALLLALTAVIMLVVLVAVHGELKGKNDTAVLILVLATLVLAWLFSNVVYALHYAHLYYSRDDDGPGDEGGLCFPDTKEPDYWDFAYFSFTLGMTFQTSDVEIASRGVRRAVLGQCLAAFVFNLGVVAFTINVLGGGGS